MPKPENELTWKDLEIGCIVTTPGNAAAYRTGDWRSQRPEFSTLRCLKCGVCALYCPEGCVRKNSQGSFEADLYYCKGCGICARECPILAITMKEEGS
jgi:pyruvate ferredoxin oxidoreductase delta subunit